MNTGIFIWMSCPKEKFLSTCSLLSSDRDKYFSVGMEDFFRNMLRMSLHFFVQDEDSMRLLSSIGLTNVTITGDTRFDRVEKLPIKNNAATNWTICGIIMCLFCGKYMACRWKETLILSGMKNCFHFQSGWSLFPYEVSKEHLSSIEQSLLQLFPDIKSCFYQNADSTNLEVTEVIIVDSIGLLSSL